MLKPTALIMVITTCGIAYAQAPKADTPPAALSPAVSPVEKEAAQRGSPAANADHGMREGVPDVTMTCRTPSMHCPITESHGSSGSSVISTDSLPLGSTTSIERGAGGPTESQYPTSPGSGSMGSGVTGSPTGPAPGPINGIGR